MHGTVQFAFLLKISVTFIIVMVVITSGITINPLKCSGVRWLHFKVLSAIQV